MSSMAKKYTKKRYQELLDELVCDNCTSEYCFLKKFMESLHPEPFVLYQLKCMEKFKWEQSEREGHEIDWNEAGALWATEGWGKVFREEFNEELTVSEVYKRVKERVLNNHP